MNKQELIKGLKDKSDDLKQLSIVGGYGKTNMPLLWQKSGVDYAIDLVAEHLDEPSREECEIIIDKIEKCDIARCGKCNNSLDIIRCGIGVNPMVHFNLPKFCSDCGAKIKRGEER